MVGILHRDVTRRDVGNHLRNEEGVVFGAVGGIYGIIACLLLEGVQTADTGSHNHSHAVAVEVFFFFNTRIFNRLTGCHHGILRIEVELAQFLAVEMSGTVKPLDFAGELGFEQ